MGNYLLVGFKEWELPLTKANAQTVAQILGNKKDTFIKLGKVTYKAMTLLMTLRLRITVGRVGGNEIKNYLKIRRQLWSDT